MTDMNSVGPKIEVQKSLARIAAQMQEFRFLNHFVKLPDAQNAIKVTTDFNLITWLVIKNAQ